MVFRTTRRRWLQAGAASAALLTAGGALRWVSGGYALPGGEVAIALTAKEMVVVRAVVEALLPGGDGLPSGLELGVHQRVDEEVWAQAEPVRQDLKAALMLLEHGPPLLGRFGRLSSLPVPDRVVVLERMLLSDVGVAVQAAAALKQLCHLHYFAHPSVWPHLGYDGPWMLVEKPPPSRLRYEELLARRRA